MGLPMTNEEITARYRQAKNKGEQVQILADLNDCPVERIIGILTANGIDNRNFNILRHKLKKEKKVDDLRKDCKKQITAQAKVAEKMQEVLYKKPEIIPGPPEPEKQLTVSDAVKAIKAEIAEINRQQYELDMRKADLYKQVWDMMGEM